MSGGDRYGERVRRRAAGVELCAAFRVFCRLHVSCADAAGHNESESEPEPDAFAETVLNCLGNDGDLTDADASR